MVTRTPNSNSVTASWIGTIVESRVRYFRRPFQYPGLRRSCAIARMRMCDAISRVGRRDTESASLRAVELTDRRAAVEPESQREASPRSDRLWRHSVEDSMPRCSRRASYHRPAKRYSVSASSSKRTRGFTAGEVRLQRGGARRPTGRRGLIRQGTAGSPFDFSGPCSFHVCRPFGCCVVEARQEFGRDIRALVERQCQGFAQKLLRT